MKTLLTTLVFLVTLTAYGQITIPWATQQPAWVFPIYFENGNQEKDTVYLAYDVNSYIPYPWPSDTIYGEKWINVDTSMFRANLGELGDSAIKASVSGEAGIIIGSIEVYRVVLPLIIRWDVSLFRDSSLPFPAHGSAPYAEALVYFGGSVLHAGPESNVCSPGDRLFITDTVFQALAGCQREDSAFFIDYLNFGINDFTTSFEFHITEWGVSGVMGIKEESIKKEYKFSPNPTTGNVHLSGNLLSYEDIMLYNAYGVLIYQLPKGTSEIELERYPPGVYYVHLVNHDNVKVIGKIIKVP
ncbi:MAG: T9SS type A sorting domain-containing protein [Flavobacteriales bacterium]|nr:T9SS type A sorting domain-containing protein [Flavobacteriales bacterium]